jgi:hypothetical protein
VPIDVPAAPRARPATRVIRSPYRPETTSNACGHDAESASGPEGVSLSSLHDEGQEAPAADLTASATAIEARVGLLAPNRGFLALRRPDRARQRPPPRRRDGSPWGSYSKDSISRSFSFFQGFNFQGFDVQGFIFQGFDFEGFVFKDSAYFSESRQGVGRGGPWRPAGA